MNDRKWILLVDDDPHDADLAMRGLRAYRPAPHVVVVRDGVEAMDCLRGGAACQSRRAPDLPVMILLDLKMPRMNGFEVLQAVKLDDRLNNVPVIIFSSSGEESDLRRSYGLGANAYVVKPVNFKEFRAAIQRIGNYWMSLNMAAPQMPLAARSAMQTRARPALARAAP
jgi:CheY-like chemotaxis protein